MMLKESMTTDGTVSEFALATGAVRRMRLLIQGAVQGVGFRPFIYRLATGLNLSGWVCNSGQGVQIEVEGLTECLDAFMNRIETEKPPRSSIQGTRCILLDPIGDSDFRVRDSVSSGEKTALVLPDIATCSDCLAEVTDPSNRRYHYPFTNCTNCGPRFSIMESLPYDRNRTTMKAFEMCPACRAEYNDPADRRFHAQPNACPVCGPHLEYWDSAGNVLAEREHALQAATDAIRLGRIVAVKGLGGFHLMVDARNLDAVLTLRHRKCREEKPFALMYPSVQSVHQDCHVSPEGLQLLLSPEAPILLIDRRERVSICDAVADAVSALGVMLPYTPLHHILMTDLGFPVVATSGNLADEPICTDETEALLRLQGIADSFLVHNRPIARHVDDSVVRLISGQPMVLRSARGYAPLPIALSESDGQMPAILAVGAHLKNTVAITGETGISISQHIGDLDTREAHGAFVKVADDLTRLLERRVDHVACDLHPDYHSTLWAKRWNLPTSTVQHHHAHIVACMLDNGLDGEVLGVAWDGTGYGIDGTVWGGEFLQATRRGFTRVAHLRSFPLPGGDVAVREPRRSALGLLYEIYGESILGDCDLTPVSAFSENERRILRRMLVGQINVPRTSSAGRLFDALASILNLCQIRRFESQAAIRVEEAALKADTPETYPYQIHDRRDDGSGQVLDWEPMIVGILADQRRQLCVAQIATKFHSTLATAIADIARRHADETGNNRVLLSGGCFQNRLLLTKSIAALEAADLVPFRHHRIPSNDGGISVGQAAVALARLRAGEE